jgi:hypothetical protein
MTIMAAQQQCRKQLSSLADVATGSKVWRRNISKVSALHVYRGVRSSLQWPGNINSNGHGQKGHHRPSISIIFQNNNNKGIGNDNIIEGGRRHRASQCRILLSALRRGDATTSQTRGTRSNVVMRGDGAMRGGGAGRWGAAA